MSFSCIRPLSFSSLLAPDCTCKHLSIVLEWSRKHAAFMFFLVFCTILLQKTIFSSTACCPICSNIVCRRLHNDWGWWRSHSYIPCQKFPLSPCVTRYYNLNTDSTSSRFYIVSQRIFLSSRYQGAGNTKSFSSWVEYLLSFFPHVVNILGSLLLYFHNQV